MSTLFTVLDIIGVIAFAISGVSKAKKYKLDLFGVITLGIITALGGGIIRDCIVDRIPVMLVNVRDFYIAFFTSLITYYVFSKRRAGLRMLMNIVKISDALGLTVFIIIGANVGIMYHMGLVGTVLLATITSVGGGVIRDMFVRETPFILKEEIYATLCIFGGAVYYAGYYFHWNMGVTTYAVIIIVFVSRVLAIKYKIHEKKGVRKTKRR